MNTPSAGGISRQGFDGLLARLREVGQGNRYASNREQRPGSYGANREQRLAAMASVTAPSSYGVDRVQRPGSYI
jgi:hypothetical protein